jgi:hypothetical protein
MHNIEIRAESTPRSLSHRDAHRKPRMPNFRVAFQVTRLPENPMNGTNYFDAYINNAGAQKRGIEDCKLACSGRTNSTTTVFVAFPSGSMHWALWRRDA